ncbi:MAG: 3'(2'),5'-bisphosphate nucleotidase CysQ [Pseudomonadota bacterium]|nr:3'(2'),5'-bisphosphate nucleotidase CysQ [Pseudomonadota bacterium]
MTPIDHSRLLSQLVPAARRAGAAILRHRHTARAELKADNSPVTEADREAERILLDALALAAPDIRVISEESANLPVADPGHRFFLVDPLDGTREFINGETDFTVNIGLIEDGRPAFGLVYAPARAELYVTLGAGAAARADLPAEASTGTDASPAYEPIKCRAPSRDGLVAAVSRSHMDAQTRAFLASHPIAETITAGSSLKFCLLAAGKADVYPRYGRTMEWDTAAGHAVLAAAGGVVLGLDGKPLAYGKMPDGLANSGFIAWGRDPGISLRA